LSTIFNLYHFVDVPLGPWVCMCFSRHEH
jgi:hypothetical protein